MISLYILGAIIFLNFFLLLLLLKASKNNKAVLYFSLSVFFVILWAVSIFLTEIDQSAIRVLWWSRLSFFFPIFMILVLLPFTFSLPSKNIRSTIFSKNSIRASYVFYIGGAFFAYATLTSLVLKDVINLKSTFGPLQSIYSMFLFLGFVYIIYLLYQGYQKTSGLLRSQFHFMLIGISISSLFAIFTNLILPITIHKEIRFLGPLGLIFFVGFTTYAIIAHRLFDIKVIIRRTVVYSVLLAFVLGVYSAVVFASAGILGGAADINRSTMIPNLIAAILIAIGFEPLRKFLTEVTDKYLFKQAYDPQLVLKQLSDTLVSVLALDEALLSMMNIVKGALRISHTAVLVIYDESTEENQVRVNSVGYVGEQKNGLNLKVSDPIIKYIRQKRSLEVVEELERRMEDENITSSRVKRIIKGANVDPLDIIRQIKVISSVVKKAKALDIAALIPIIVRDKVIGIFVIGPKLSGDSFTDTDLKTLEIISGQTASAIEQARLYEDDQTKSEFVSIASHELLTPTTAIEGYLSMILDEHMASVDDTARKYLQRVQTSAHRLSNLVKDLLSVSRIEAGRIKIKIEPIQVEPLIEGVIGDLLPTTQEKRLSLTFLKSDQSLPLCLADPDKLTQVVINLVGNAIKYTPEGSILVLAESFEDKIKITIEDTGIGIRTEDLPHLFEKFYRVDNTETVGIVGSGLGLYISKSMIELMDGAIDVESTEWHGSRFIITLPTVVDSEGEKKSRK